ncbi:MAG TPA: amino acid adenylation domain-containing protein [Burkholderiales bacterium]
MSRLLQERFHVRAQARPEALAVSGAQVRLSYGALEAAANRLARLLLHLGCRRGDRIALLAPKSPATIVGLLATLKAGAAYVPLDPAGPAERLARMLEAAECSFILAGGAATAMLRDTLACTAPARRPQIGWLDSGDLSAPGEPAAFGVRDIAAFEASLPPAAGTPDDLAHLLFTSGSTGQPKGVMIAQRSVLAFLDWACAHFGIAPTDRLSQHAPLHFDLSTFDIFGALTSGAELHLVPSSLGLLPHKLAQFIREARLTQWFSVPAALTQMAQLGVLRDGDFPDLRRVLWCGEAMPTPTLVHWMRRVPHARYTNLYGPTEATIASSHYTVPRCPRDEREPIPIGSACDGEELMILDEALHSLRPGVTGELYIRGVGLSPGYWRDAEKTRAAFLPFPGGAGPQDRVYRTGDLAWRDAAGCFHFVGRADTQIKSRGYRIELGEIEAALHTLPDLAESAVVAIPSEGFEGWLICCAFVPAPPGEPAPGRVREGLSKLLPGYMLPARWMRCDALPRNGNGKVDRPRLRTAFQDAAVAAAEPRAAARA